MPAPPEICEDVKEECAKYGHVLELKVPRPSGGRHGPGVGKIFVKYDSPESAQKALRALAGRKFADRTVVVTFFGEVSRLPLERTIFLRLGTGWLMCGLTGILRYQRMVDVGLSVVGSFCPAFRGTFLAACLPLELCFLVSPVVDAIQQLLSACRPSRLSVCNFSNGGMTTGSV